MKAAACWGSYCCFDLAAQRGENFDAVATQRMVKGCLVVLFLSQLSLCDVDDVW